MLTLYIDGQLKNFVWVYGYSQTTREKLMEIDRKNGAIVFADRDSLDGYWIDFEHYDH